MSYNESLRSNSNYPPMSQSQWDAAPFNEEVIPEKDFEVTCSQSLSKTVTITTDNYIPGGEWCEYDDGITIGGHDPDDTSDTDWAEEYHLNDHYTPLELIDKFKEYLMKQWDILKNAEEANDAETKQKKREIKHLIEECSGWQDDDTEIIMEE